MKLTLKITDKYIRSRYCNKIYEDRLRDEKEGGGCIGVSSD